MLVDGGGWCPPWLTKPRKTDRPLVLCSETYDEDRDKGEDEDEDEDEDEGMRLLKEYGQH
jgi:hypothetical protein